MTLSSQVLTATMAKLYADQGYLRKAAVIYRQLLDGQPHRQDLAEALAHVEEQIANRKCPPRKELEMLIREWIDLQKQLACRQKDSEKDSP